MPWQPDYLTLAEGREYLRVPTADTGDDGLIESLITAASRAIDTRCRRQFGRSDPDTVRRYPARQTVPMIDGSGWLLVVDDVATSPPAAVADDAGPLPAGSYEWVPWNAAQDGRPYEALLLTAAPVGTVTVTGAFGWPTVPDQVATACRLQLARWWVRRESPYGTAGTPSDGSETRLLTRLDPDVAVVLVGLARGRVPA